MKLAAASSNSKKGRPPPPPDFVLRSHTTDVTAVCFCYNVPLINDAIGDCEKYSSSPLTSSLSLENCLVSGSVDGLLKCWDIESRRVVLVLNEHSGKGILNVEWVTNRCCFLSQGRDGYIKMWHLTGKKATNSELLVFQVQCVATMDSGSYTFTKLSINTLQMPNILVAPARNDSFFEIWNLETNQAMIGHCVARTEDQQGGVTRKTGMIMCLKLIVGTLNSSNDSLSSSVIVGVESGEIGIFLNADSTSPTNLVTVKKKEMSDDSEVNTEVDSNNSNENVGQNLDNSLATKLLGLTGDQAQWSGQIHNEPILCIDFIHSSKTDSFFGISGSADSNIGVYHIDSNTGQFNTAMNTAIQLKNPGISDVKIRSDGKLFGTCGWDGYIRLFSVKKLQPLAVLSYHEGSGVHTIEFGPVDSGTICTASKDGKIAWWSIYGKIKTKVK
jgi:WD40 repeat protein